MMTNQDQNQPNATNRPSHYGYRVDSTGKAASWTKIGAMWPNRDGDGFTLILNGIEQDIRIVLREPKLP